MISDAELEAIGFERWSFVGVGQVLCPDCDDVVPEVPAESLQDAVQAVSDHECSP